MRVLREPPLYGSHRVRVTVRDRVRVRVRVRVRIGEPLPCNSPEERLRWLPWWGVDHRQRVGAGCDI